MLDSLSLGTYFPGDSPVHRLQARTKLAAIPWLTLVLVIANRHMWHFAPYAAAVVLTLVAIVVSGVPPTQIWRRIRLLMLTAAIGAIPVILFTEGTQLGTIGPVVVTREGVWLLFSLFLVLLILYTLSLLLTMTTTPAALLEGMTILLGPLRRFHLPVDDFVLMTLLAIRFVPTLAEEIDQLIKAQASRGADFRHGTPEQRLRGLPAMFIPMVNGALRRAADLATALESRGYELQEGYTLLHEGPLGKLDYAAIAALGAVTLITLLAA